LTNCVFDPNGVSSEVEMKAIDILEAIRTGHSSLAEIAKYVESHGVNVSFSSPNESMFPADDYQQVRIEMVLEELLERGVVSQ